MSRDERIEAAADAVRAIDGPASIGSAEVVDAALAASDALLRTPAAAERAAWAVALEEGWVVEDWHGGFMHPAAKEKCRRIARAVTAALLDGEA